ncbi:SDR family NAD(P)-dependent oxidoreductase [Rhodococcus sp. G-MC3]|uniref:SDR family NAD(P)-dependent oxidoreductase n=1 Tax=Rhodococcus sp. G-MC3 TaxID=3046209 RepID=UPI0024B8E020|nr:SDR family NAD(P)-dependent oxidoreductase [Rhodococcus sp. G-MC3]MDJ0392284.1 SDR family NAD(P)-dependent oxidoreductase [Rhodococcus sp. G-MC3]
MTSVTSILDNLLDRAVVPGYSRIGATVRSRFWGADPAPFPVPIDIVVTGGSSGLGAATATALAKLGARVHLVGRSTERLEKSAGLIRQAASEATIVVHECDVSDLDSVARLVTDLTSELTGIHALVHCAGVMPPERTVTAQGHEAALATHVLGPVALTVGLRELFDAGSRVIFVSSGGMYPVPLHTQDFEFSSGKYSAMTAYARTKRMQVVVTEQLAEHLIEENDPVVHSMHPGWAATPGVTDSIPLFGNIMKPILRSAEQGADTIVWLAAGDEALTCTGRFWHDRATRPTHYPSWRKDSPQARDSLWSKVVEATSVEL